MRALSVAVAFLCALSGAAHAQESNWTLTLGPGLQIAPAYEGAGHYALLPFPWISIGVRDQLPPFAAPDDSPGIALTSGTFRVGAIVAFRGERTATSERIGLAPVEWALEPGLSGEFWPVPWLRTRAELRKGVRGHVGWVADLRADAVAMRGPWTFSAGPSIGWGNSRYMRTYFGVSPAEAAANPFIVNPHSAEAGLRYVGASASVLHRHGRWAEVIGVAYHRLVGDAAASPLVKQFGDADQIIVNLGIMYRFNGF